MSNKETLEQYKTSGVPVFFVLGEDRVVKDVIVGFIEGSTEEELRTAVSKEL